MHASTSTKDANPQPTTSIEVIEKVQADLTVEVAMCISTGSSQNSISEIREQLGSYNRNGLNKHPYQVVNQVELSVETQERELRELVPSIRTWLSVLGLTWRA